MVNRVVSQGSVMGTLLLLLLINNINTVNQYEIHLFADYTLVNFVT